MNYIERVGTNEGLVYFMLALGVLGALSTAVFITLLVRRTKENASDASGPFIGVFFSIIALISGLTVSFLAAGPDSMEARGEQLHSFQKEAEKTYGITIRESQVQQLKYPRDKPRGGTQSFGSFKQTAAVGDGKFLRRELTLVWVDGKMVLAESTNGEDFTPLKTRS